jgi:hypothetical protein
MQMKHSWLTHSVLPVEKRTSMSVEIVRITSSASDVE